MTRQFPDIVRYDGRDYNLTAVDGVGLFDPLVHGLTPRMLGTACWRGFVGTYAVEGDQLYLADLVIGLEGLARTAITIRRQRITGGWRRRSGTRGAR